MSIALLDDRAVIRVAGPAAETFLQGLFTQDMTVAERGLAFAALLSPQGKIIAEFILAKRPDGYLLDCHAGVADALAKKLTLYRLRAAVEIARTADVIAIDVAVDVGGPTGEFLPDPRLGALPARAVGPLAAFQGAASGLEDYERRRIALGVPELGKDFAAEEMFLLDVNYDALNGVSYRKGCFVGQEVTSRMKRKGEIRRRTFVARFDGAPPTKGAVVTAGDSTLGEILTGTEGAALAAIRVDRVEAARARGEAILADGRKIRIEAPAYLHPQ
jgi:hypothetical protein